MAENAIRAFGRYLKALRDRRGLSLNEVCSRSEPFAERVNKGYLSRCENGFQRLALTKVIPLSRIYEVSADALVERMELDLELDRVGGPVTEGMSFSKLLELGKRAINEGFGWHAYGALRDAIPVSTVELNELHRDITEQGLCAIRNCANSAMLLGRYRFALHELLYLEKQCGLGPRARFILLERLSACYRGLKQLELSQKTADRAIAEAEAAAESESVGYLYTNRGRTALMAGHPEIAAEFFQKAYDSHKSHGRGYETARALHNLSQAYVILGRLRAARRVLASAEVRLRELNQQRALALGRILLGEIEALEGRPELAVNLWREAVDLSKDLGDKTLRFQAEFRLLQDAIRRNDPVLTRTLNRRLRRLSSWVAADTSELEEFLRIQPLEERRVN